MVSDNVDGRFCVQIFQNVKIITVWKKLKTLSRKDFSITQSVGNRSCGEFYLIPRIYG